MNEREPLTSLKMVLKEAYESAYSDFYRSHYASKGFVPDFSDFTRDQWRDVPCIVKSDLADRPYFERTFLPMDEAKYIHVSSGTTKSPLVLNLRNKLWKAYAHKEYADRMLFFRGGGFLFDVYKAENIASIVGDMKDHAATARLAARFKVQAIMTTAAHLCALTPYLEKEMTLSDITLFVSSGDRFSHAAYEFIREHYPRAIIRNTYGTAETGGLHWQSCAEIEATGKNLVHYAENDVYPELIDAEGRVVDEEGELVVTLLWEHNMLPIIRFRTGDIARRVPSVCSCGRETYEILGRAGYDFMRIPGGLLKAEHVESAVERASSDIDDDYELRISDPEIGSLKVRAELWLRPKPGRSINYEDIARFVAAALPIGPERFFADGVADGMYEPLVCKELPPRPAPPKYRRIVRVDQ